MHINIRASGLHAAVVGFCNAAIQLVQAFGVRMTSDQDAAITAVVNSLLLVLSLLIIQATNGADSGPKVP